MRFGPGGISEEMRWPWAGTSMTRAGTIACLLLCFAVSLPMTARANCAGWDKSEPGYDPQYYSVSHEFRRSKYVVEARVVRETWLGEDGKEKPLQPPFQNGSRKPWGFDPYIGAYYDVQVLKSFKGGAPRILRLYSENTTARFWLDVGSRQILFVSEAPFDQPVGHGLTIDTCGKSAALAKASALLRDLRKLARPAQPPNTARSASATRPTSSSAIPG